MIKRRFFKQDHGDKSATDSDSSSSSDPSPKPSQEEEVDGDDDPIGRAENEEVDKPPSPSPGLNLYAINFTVVWCLRKKKKSCLLFQWIFVSFWVILRCVHWLLLDFSGVFDGILHSHWDEIWTLFLLAWHLNSRESEKKKKSLQFEWEMKIFFDHWDCASSVTNVYIMKSDGYHCTNWVLYWPN